VREEAQEAQEVARAAREALEAFNRGDMKPAWGGLPEGFEWHPMPEWPDARVAVGPEDVFADRDQALAEAGVS
jgi:hypothetical protein